MAKIDLFSWWMKQKNNKWSLKNKQISTKLEKLVFNLMNITKIGKTLKPKKIYNFR